MIRLRIHYTDDELIFNNLLIKVQAAISSKEARINRAIRQLQPLGVTSKRLTDFVEEIIYEDDNE